MQFFCVVFFFSNFGWQFPSWSFFGAKLGQDLCMSNCAMINESHPGCNHDHQKTRFSFLKVWIFRAKASPSSILGPSRLSLINFRGAPKLWTPAVLFHRSQNNPEQRCWLVWCPFLSSFNAIRTNGNSLMNFGIFQSTKSQTSLKIGNFGSFFYGTSRNHQMVQRHWFL